MIVSSHKLSWKDTFPFFLILIITVIAFFGLQNTFYQQDEWQTLGHNLIAGWRIITKDLSLLQIFFAEGRVLSKIFYLIFLGSYRFTVTPVLTFAVLCHTLNAWLVYLLIKKFKSDILAAWVCAIFFAVNSVADQTVIWVSAVVTLPATTLLLLSIYWYLNFLESKNFRYRNLAFGAGILSLFFKETGLFIFLLFPLMYVLWGKAKNLRDVIRNHALLLIYGIALVMFRLMELSNTPQSAAGFVSPGQGLLFPVIYHSIAYPLISLFQVFVPANDMYAFVPKIAREEYTYLLGSPLFDLVGQSAVADVVSLIGTIILSTVIGIMIWLDRERKQTNKIVLLGFMLFILSFLPYAVLHKDFSYMSSRYYYVGVIGAAMLFGYAASWLYKRLSLLWRVPLFICIGLYLLYQTQAIRKDIVVQVTLAQERKTFLSEIRRVHPAMQSQTVFYITSDKKYLGEITYPFQNGLGYILEVLYYQTGKIPKRFLASDFLWDLGSEGYQTTGTYGFGYFQHLNPIGDLVKQQRITPDVVYGYTYNSGNQKMLDTTLAVREQLATLSGTLQ